MPTDPDEFWAKLEELGEDEVRKRLASGRVYGSEKKPLVEEWLRRREATLAEALETEQRLIASRAADAAERAAAASERSAAASERSAEAAERDAAASERSAQTSEASSRSARTSKMIMMAMFIVTAIGILVTVLSR